jgi:carbon dioxide concentrating mechanism protein CcmN
MHSLPPSLTPNTHYAVSGDVSIDPSAAIASGSLLLAEPGCTLTIGVGVCVGTGSVLHAFGGNLVVETGAILGSAVLLIGNGSIGEYACVGAMSTLINAIIQPRQGIQQESCVFGDEPLDFSGAIHAAAPNGHYGRSPAPNSHLATAYPSNGAFSSTSSNGSVNGVQVPNSSNPASAPGFSATSGSLPFQPADGKRVYGLEAYYRLIAMLFPHRDFTMVATSPPRSRSDQTHSLTPQEGKDSQPW